MKYTTGQTKIRADGRTDAEPYTHFSRRLPAIPEQPDGQGRGRGCPSEVHEVGKIITRPFRAGFEAGVRTILPLFHAA